MPTPTSVRLQGTHGHSPTAQPSPWTELAGHLLKRSSPPAKAQLYDPAVHPYLFCNDFHIRQFPFFKRLKLEQASLIKYALLACLHEDKILKEKNEDQGPLGEEQPIVFSILSPLPLSFI